MTTTKQPDTKTIARTIDHSLLHPTMTDEQIRAGCELARRCGVATVCVKPYCVAAAAGMLRGSGVGVCAVCAFPHGNSRTDIKVFEAERAIGEGAGEIDVVINIGKAMGGDWDYVANEIRAVNEACVGHGAILKVIFENDYLKDEHIVQLCGICSRQRVAFVKTSTGFGFVKLPGGDYNYRGATERHLRLMRAHCGNHVRIKAAGGVRTLDELLKVLSFGAERVGTSSTQAILAEAVAHGLGPL